MAEIKEIDEYDIKLENVTNDLLECQKNLDTFSCLNCEKILGCPTRKAYVKAVYESMSKGQAGGFEF